MQVKTRECCLAPDVQGIVLHDHPVMQRIYESRSVHDKKLLSNKLEHLLPFHSLKGIDYAVKRIALAMQEQQNILIVGDFDTDGATSCALGMRALAAMGARHVDFLVPDRFTYGYGLTPGILEVAKTKSPDLIITVDNGIASIEGVDAANLAGIDVIVTDHHIAPKVLPKAYAIVNPNQPGDDFPSKCLAGVGVIFYVMLALRSHLRDTDWFQGGRTCPNMADYLDLVALGTVSDLVPLDHNNRILIDQGLKRIRKGRTCLGILALLALSKRDFTRICAADLGFAVGPRLNAAGRLDDMSIGVHCLLTSDPREANRLAKELDALNHKRREIEYAMREEAFTLLEQIDLSVSMPFGVCVYQDDWHQGVVGLVASKVKDVLHRPVIAFAKSDEKTLKGSARSISGLHIRDALDRIAVQNPHILSRFGGHAMAAGLSIALDDYEEFSRLFNETVTQLVPSTALNEVCESDGELLPGEFTLPVAEMIASGGPWGQGFPEPLFVGEFQVLTQQLLAGKHLRCILQPKGSQRTVEAIAFYVDAERWPNPACVEMNILYRVSVNVYNGLKKFQVVIERFLSQDATSELEELNPS